MKSILIKNGRLITDGFIKNGDLLIIDGKIAAIGYGFNIPENTQIIDAENKYVAPGFIDIHLHGGGGYDFMDCSLEAFKAISETHLKNGTTTMVPTAVSAKFEDILKLIETYKEAIPHCPNFYGIHLEGPYISKNQKGAHHEELLHAPTDDETDTLLKVGKGIIKRITAAPELENMDSFSRKMTENGINLALGHSDATSDIALKAFKNGFSHVTHLYSATPGVRKINQVVKAGVIEAAYLDDNVTVELIADGKHAAVDALRLAVKIKGTDMVALVTDALRPAGTNVTESWLGAKIPENRVIIEDGVAKLPDRSSFAGSIATSNMLLKQSVLHYGIPLADSVKMITGTTAKILGLKSKGRLCENFDADIVIFDEKYDLESVILKGEIYISN